MNKITGTRRVALAITIVGIIAMLVIAYAHHDGWPIYLMAGLFASIVTYDTIGPGRPERGADK